MLYYDTFSEAIVLFIIAILVILTTIFIFPELNEILSILSDESTITESYVEDHNSALIAEVFPTVDVDEYVASIDSIDDYDIEQLNEVSDYEFIRHIDENQSELIDNLIGNVNIEFDEEIDRLIITIKPIDKE